MEIIKNHCEDIKEFQNLKLESCSLDNYREKIIELYESIKEEVGPVGATKLLHLLSPNFFPPWDTDIRNHVKRESNKKINPTGTGYCNYMLEIQKLLRYNQGVWEKLTKDYNESTKLRVVDIYLWSKIQEFK